MLDLKKLEDKLDKALANETSESLTIWLQEKRLRNHLQSLGEGRFENIYQTISSVILVESDSFSFEIEFSSIPVSKKYIIAA